MRRLEQDLVRSAHQISKQLFAAGATVHYLQKVQRFTPCLCSVFTWHLWISSKDMHSNDALVFAQLSCKLNNRSPNLISQRMLVGRKFEGRRFLSIFNFKGGPCLWRAKRTDAGRHACALGPVSWRVEKYANISRGRDYALNIQVDQREVYLPGSHCVQEQAASHSPVLFFLNKNEIVGGFGLQRRGLCRRGRDNRRES
jgi:hypothetical protein